MTVRADTTVSQGKSRRDARIAFAAFMVNSSSKIFRFVVRTVLAIVLSALFALATFLCVEPSRGTELFVIGAGLWVVGVAIKGAVYFFFERTLGRSYLDWHGISGYLAHSLFSLNELLPYLAFIWLGLDTANTKFLVECVVVAYGSAAFEIVLLISLPSSLQFNDVDIVDHQDRPISTPVAIALSIIERVLAASIHITARLGVAVGLLFGPIWLAAVCAACFAFVEAEAIRLVRDRPCRMTSVIKYYAVVSVLVSVSTVALALVINGGCQ